MLKLLKTIIIISIVLFSCQKKKIIIENIQVVSNIDLSIPTESDIIDFSILDSNTFFALAKSVLNKYEIYKSDNGGTSWIQIPFNNAQYFSSFNELEFQSFEFVDENNGVLVSNSKALRTFNGGLTWTAVTTPPDVYGNSSSQFIFAGNNGNGQFIFAEAVGNSWYRDHIYKSDFNTNTYQLVNLRFNNGFVFTNASMTNGKLIFLVNDFNYWDEICLSYDLSLNRFDTLSSTVCPSDLYYESDDSYYAIFPEGLLALFKKDSYYSLYHPNTYFKYEFYQYHERPYRDIEKIENYFVIVGDHSINTNLSGDWEEIITSKGTGQQENFFKVKKLDKKYFIISGEKGLFKKCWFQ